MQDASHLNIKGFKSVLNARPRGSRGGGTMIYYNESFNVTPILNDSFFRPNIFESTALQISIPGKARFIACSVYRPNTHRELNDSNQIKAFFTNY